jgi:hypothetical protein
MRTNLSSFDVSLMSHIVPGYNNTGSVEVKSNVHDWGSGSFALLAHFISSSTEEMFAQLFLVFFLSANLGLSQSCLSQLFDEIPERKNVTEIRQQVTIDMHLHLYEHKLNIANGRSWAGPASGWRTARCE